MLKRLNRYALEHAFLATAIAVSVLGFWELYFAEGARPNGHHHLHGLTNFAWLSLLLCQVRLIETRQHGSHRAFGLAVLVLGPLLVASTALLSVHSASAQGRRSASRVRPDADATMRSLGPTPQGKDT